MSYDVSKAIFAGDEAALRALSASDPTFFNQSTPSEGWTLLHRALLHPTELTPLPMIKFLLEAGINPNASDCYGNTALQYAARSKYTAAIGLLLDFGASIDLANRDCVTPLRQTLLSRPYSLPATEMLLARGADPLAKGKTGKTVRDYVEVVAHGSDVVLRELFNKYQSE